MVAQPDVYRPARSTLLRGGVASLPRPRRYFQRRLVVFAAVACALAGVIAVFLRFFPLSGPTRAIYWAHDVLWLPLYAAIWTSAFPYGLIWLAPLGAFCLMAGLEFMGFAQGFRRGQLAVFSVLLSSGLDPLLIASNRLAARRAGPEGTLLEALAKERDAAALTTVLAKGSAGLASLQRYRRLLLNLRPDQQSRAIATIEAMCLSRSLNRPEDPNLRGALAQHWPDLAGAWAEWTAKLPQNGVDGLTAGIVQSMAGLSSMPAKDLALATLRHSLQTGPGNLALLSWFSAWSDLRYAAGPAAATLAEAEAMIQFEYWAARSEVPPSPAELDGLLSSALPTLAPLRDRGERAAYLIGSTDRSGGPE